MALNMIWSPRADREGGGVPVLLLCDREGGGGVADRAVQEGGAGVGLSILHKLEAELQISTGRS